jgi:hypothetical protein
LTKTWCTRARNDPTLAERAGAVGIGNVLKKPLQSRDIAVSLAHRARLARLNET